MIKNYFFVLLIFCLLIFIDKKTILFGLINDGYISIKGHLHSIEKDTEIILIDIDTRYEDYSIHGTRERIELNILKDIPSEIKDVAKVIFIDFKRNGNDPRPNLYNSNDLQIIQNNKKYLNKVFYATPGIIDLDVILKIKEKYLYT